MTSFGCCDPAHLGAICRRASAPTPPATTVSFAGGGLASGGSGRCQLGETRRMRPRLHLRELPQLPERDMALRHLPLTPHAIADLRALPNATSYSLASRSNSSI